MMDQMERELIAEKKFREAAEELVNAKTDMLDMRTHICKDSVKYFIRIWKEDFEDTLRREMMEIDSLGDREIKKLKEKGDKK